jgi:8-oxo-dGTP pyrophosphatase MutT (NUDIX family)
VKLTCNAALRKRFSQRLQRFEPLEIDAQGKKHAAIAFTLMNCACPANIADIPFDPSQADQLAFLLTTRASGLSNHPGQRAYPGGRVDAGESAEQAALRELAEEVGLLLKPDSILGRLDDYETRSGFIISPFVVWGGNDVELQANPAEVAQIHRIPLVELLRDDAPILESIPECEQPILKMPLGVERFAAPSAVIAYQFREVVLLGRQTRVAHYDQPRFAWN